MVFVAYENTNNSVMKEGDYEVILAKCEEGTTKSKGDPVINFDFVVRSDVEQPYQKKHVFKSFYQDESGEWPLEKIGKYANSLGIEKGASFELDDLVGKCCILHVKPFTGNDGVERETIYFTLPTKAGQAVQSVAEAGFSMVVDDDAPF